MASEEDQEQDDDGCFRFSSRIVFSSKRDQVDGFEHIGSEDFCHGDILGMMTYWVLSWAGVWLIIFRFRLCFAGLVF